MGILGPKSKKTVGRLAERYDSVWNILEAAIMCY